jgi:hypothetical protein
LPQFAAGLLSAAEAAEVEAHLRECPACRADLSLWSALAGGVREAYGEPEASPDLADRSLRRIRVLGRKPPAPVRAAQLLAAQIPVIRREIWSVSALVILLGFLVALTGEKAAVLREVAPMVAAAGIALLIGPQNDPTEELTRAVPVSRRQILLARVALVFGFNLMLAGAASVGLFPMLPQALWGGLILAWLGPMAFLSSLALLFSLWMRTVGAVALVYAVWLSQLVLPGMDSLFGWSGRFAAAGSLLAAYGRFWNSPAVLLTASIVVFAVVFWLAGRESAGWKNGT